MEISPAVWIVFHDGFKTFFDEKEAIDCFDYYKNIGAIIQVYYK